MRQRASYFLATFILLIHSSNLACALFPKKEICENPSPKKAQGINEETFHKILDKIYHLYAPIFSTRGKDFNIQRRWKDEKLNSSALQAGNTWTIKISGALARHHFMTPDGFALVACHEIGHHLGGLPKSKLPWVGSWSSNEGQADYFASLKCLRKYMEDNDNVAIMDHISTPHFVTEKCKENFSTPEKVAICKRSALAGMSLAKISAEHQHLSKPLRFDTPDPQILSSTYDGHGGAQCRLDTYFAGSLCPKSHEEDIHENDINWGQCARIDGHTLQARPLCWYKPEE